VVNSCRVYNCRYQSAILFLWGFLWGTYRFSTKSSVSLPKPTTRFILLLSLHFQSGFQVCLMMRTLFWNQECQCLQGSRFVLRQQVRKWKSVRFVNKSFFQRQRNSRRRGKEIRIKDEGYLQGGRHRGSVRRGELKRVVTAVPRNQEHKWQQRKGTKEVRKGLMYASEDIILLPPASQHATCTHHNVPRHLHHSRRWPPNKMTWRSTEHGGWLMVDDDTPAASELATVRSQSSFKPAGTKVTSQSHLAKQA